jgi:hypothetical protein
MKKLLYTLIVILLTILTQIGGILFLISLWIAQKRSVNTILIFLPLYIIATFLLIPHLAPLLGREPIKHSNKIEPTNYLTIILNRNYVRPELNQLLHKTEQYLVNNPFKIRYLDASFPFIDRFPLLPHLSHNDGKKIDISFIYQNNQSIVDDKKSRSGYGVFVPIKRGEYNQTKACKEKGAFQYDYPKYLTLGRINDELIFSEQGTIDLIKALLKNRELGKLFIEPNLKKRLGLTDSRVRNHGCRAVRHDDHIHVQLR